jgi:16S rRNA (guanine(527)-N(7))-methyltransferase RsmG
MTNDNQRRRMEDIFRRSGLTLTQKQSDDFWAFYCLFERYNDEYDLSRIKKFDDIIMKHFVDSAIIASMVEIPSPVLDIGTGAGFPGIPLKIMNRDLEIILAEPKDKRVAFMELVIRELSLDGAAVYPKRVGDHCDFNLGGVITRAFEAVDGTLSRVRHFLPEHGKVIFLKGPGVEEDLGLISHENFRDYKIIHDQEYELPGTLNLRRLVVFEKISSFREHVYTATDPRYAKIFISSSENKTLKEYKKLSDSKGVKKSGKTIVSGKKIISELADKNFDKCDALILFDEYRERSSAFHDVIGKFLASGKLVMLKKSLFNELDIFSSDSPLCVYECPSIRPWDFSAQGCTLLVPFQDPSNVGAVIRSAAAFGVKKVVLLSEASHPFHPKSIRSSAGSVFSVEIVSGPSINDISDLCAEKNIPLVTLDAHGEDIRRTEFPEDFLILPGLEGPGLPESCIAKAVSVPIEAVESLNASAATAVALFYINRIRN